MFRRNFQKVEIVGTSDEPPEYLTISCEPATISAKPVGAGAASQLLIPRDETIFVADAHRGDSQPSLCVRMKG
jgi:hypothetical protein